MSETDSRFSEESLRKIAEQKVIFRAALKMHSLIYILANSFLGFINYVFSPAFLWFLFPLFAWLIGLVIHFTLYLLYARGVYPKSKKTVILIFIAYFFVVLLLFVINYVTLGEINWALYPAVFAGVGVLICIITYLVFYRSKITQSGDIKTKKQRAIEKEMERMRQRMDKKKAE